MKWIKYITHPHAYILFFIVISVLAFIPNGLGWRHNMEGLTQQYLWLYILYVCFYFLGFYSLKAKKPNKYTDLDLNTINRFHVVFIICVCFFILKFIYVGGIPILSDDRFLRTKVSSLGGYVDFPSKGVSVLGIVAYYFYLKRKNKLYLTQFLASILLNFLFAERSLIVFTILGAVILYVNFNVISRKIFKRVTLTTALMLFLIGWIQIIRHGGKNNLNLSGEMSTLQVVSWVVHGDLVGSQKFGAYVTNELGEEHLYGKYTFGIFLSIFIPDYKEHGASYLHKRFSPNSNSAQSASIPYSYYMDFGLLSLSLPFIIGVISRRFYQRFKFLNSPINIALYPAFFFNLLWSVRAGNFPIDPKLIYFVFMMIFIFNPVFEKRINNELCQLLRLGFLMSLVLSLVALIIRWW